jgi:hypothetical protein
LFGNFKEEKTQILSKREIKEEKGRELTLRAVLVI